MPSGLLEMTGTIDLDQFWPAGTSDADTTKILVDVAHNAFRFRRSPGDPFQVTHAFDDAVVAGKVRKPAIDPHGRVTVRLQGIDAPELHYQPSAVVKKAQQTSTQRTLYLRWNLDYRQLYGETATVALRVQAQKANRNPLPCTVVSAVDSPNDVFDTYGRLVGDIVVEINGSAVNLNHWLLQAGWAAPTFYTSMTADEITSLTALAQEARTQKHGFWPDFTQKITAFDWNLQFRGKGAPPDPAADQGPVMLPKLFRRQATYKVNQRSKMFSGSFEKYLLQQRDDLHLVAEFLSQGPAAAPIRFLHEFVNAGRLTVDPAELVFRERPSRLTRPGGGEVNW